MSSTARGGVREADDFYETGPEAAQPMLDHLLPYLRDRPVIFEPMAGRGALVKLLRKTWPNAVIIANELNPERASMLHAAGADITFCRDLFSQGFLDSVVAKHKPDLAFTNPAFKFALEVASALIPRVPRVDLLQRLGWLGSQERLPFWARQTYDFGILAHRPSFAASLQCADWITSDAVLAAGWMPVSNKKRASWKRNACGWAVIQYLDAPRNKTCPECGNPVKVSTSDSADYAWYDFFKESKNQHFHLGRVESAEQQALAGVA